MKQIIASRGTGKSTQLLRTALNEKANLAVCYHSQLRYYADIAKSLGINESEIEVTPYYLKIRDTVVAPIYKFMEHPTSSLFSRKPLYIDELDWCMKSLLDYCELSGYSISLEDNHLELE